MNPSVQKPGSSTSELFSSKISNSSSLPPPTMGFSSGETLEECERASNNNGSSREVNQSGVSRTESVKSRWSLPDVGNRLFILSSNSLRNFPSKDPLSNELTLAPAIMYPSIYGKGQRGSLSSLSGQLGCMTKILASRIFQWISKVFVIYPIVLFAVWSLLYILWGEGQSFPGGSLFGLVVLEVSCIFAGKILDYFGLPPALGMISAGFLLRNVPTLNVVTDIDPTLSSSLRAISVVILLSRGALSVKIPVIRRFWRIIPPLAVLSCMFEAVVGGLAVYLIVQWPVEWAAAMGCILSAMSQAIVLPYLNGMDTSCSERNKKVLTIAKNACGLDAILAICMAEFAFGFIFAKGDVSSGFTKGMAEVVMGGVFGLFWGTVVGYLFDDSRGAKLQTFALLTGGIMGLLGLTKIGYPRGGPLGTFSGVLVAASIWKSKCKEDGNCETKISEIYTDLWFFFQPLLFGIIGSRTDFTTVNWDIVSRGILCLAVSLVGRILIALVLTGYEGLSWRHRAFLAVAWLPKGTVQAALGPVVLDTAIDLASGADTEDLGYQMMNIAAAVIVLGSSLGCLCLRFLGKRLLVKSM